MTMRLDYRPQKSVMLNQAGKGGYMCVCVCVYTLQDFTYIRGSDQPFSLPCNCTFSN